jgi:hypothetical protein
MGYNSSMRTLAMTLLLLAWPLITCAQDCACVSAVVPCASPAQLAADRAGGCIIELSACLTGGTSCAVPRHRCAPTLYPGATCLPVRCVTHQPLACVEPCPKPTCVPRACHLPVVTMWVDDPCPADAVLTGTPDLIVHERACGES